MAGMLPGVECARRRRCHQSGWTGWTDSQGLNGQGRTRRFCLYTSNHEPPLNSNSLLRNAGNQTGQEDTLDGAARVAKQRLDEKLRSQRKLESKCLNSKERMKTESSDSMILGLQTEVYGSKRRFSWRKLGRKASDQEECAVCLERFKGGQTLVNLPCAHRFHSMCLVPWLANNTQCPCCRTDLIAWNNR